MQCLPIIVRRLRTPHAGEATGGFFGRRIHRQACNVQHAEHLLGRFPASAGKNVADECDRTAEQKRGARSCANGRRERDVSGAAFIARAHAAPQLDRDVGFAEFTPRAIQVKFQRVRDPGPPPRVSRKAPPASCPRVAAPSRSRGTGAAGPTNRRSYSAIVRTPSSRVPLNNASTQPGVAPSVSA